MYLKCILQYNDNFDWFVTEMYILYFRIQKLNILTATPQHVEQWQDVIYIWSKSGNIEIN